MPKAESEGHDDVAQDGPEDYEGDDAPGQDGTPQKPLQSRVRRREHRCGVQQQQRPQDEEGGVVAQGGAEIEVHKGVQGARGAAAGAVVAGEQL